jgi:hypothetical protein
MRSRLVRRLPWLVVVVTAAAVAFPLGVIASHQFSDVPTTSPYHTDIDALADNGITTGCGAGIYCPKAFVTREQMAAFMNRLGALSPGKAPVVNADKVDGVDEVLAAGAIVNIQQGPWFPNGSSIVTTLHSYDVDTISRAVAGTSSAIMSLDGPTSIGGTAYGLASVEICYGGTDSTILGTSVYQTESPLSAVARIVDPTDRATTVDTCYTVTDPSPNAKEGAIHVVLEIQFSEAGAVLWPGNVTSTWVPIG